MTRSNVVEALEGAQDLAAVRASRARRSAGKNDGLRVVLYRRMRAGEHPIRVWRAHRKLTLGALAGRASIARAYLSEVETGKKPGRVVALQRIARAPSVDIDDLVPDISTKTRRKRC
jgi:DNA-binding Xre family transcriptional regulator